MASEIRVDKINSLSGVGTVTLSPTGVDIAGITTAATLKATTGIVTTLTATTGIVTTFEATTGNITTLRAPTGISTHFTADIISLPDTSNGSLNIGVGSDFKFNHDGTHSYITEVGGGDLYIQGSDIILRDAGTLEKHIEMTQNGAVDIYHNGTKKLETHTQGAAIGSAGITIPTMNSFSCQILAGASGFIGNYHDGTTNQQLILGLNQYFDSSYKAKTNATSTQLQFYDRSFRFNTAPAPGSAGGALSQVQALRIDTDGIKFGTDTAAANALDDYEEGTWTPDFENRTSTVPNTREGRYRKIGSQVFAYLHLNYNVSLVTSTGLVNISGLPFTSSSGHSVYGAATSIHMNNSFTVGNDEAFLNILVPPNSNIGNVYFRSGSSNVHLPSSRMGTGNLLTCLVYFVN